MIYFFKQNVVVNINVVLNTVRYTVAKEFFFETAVTKLKSRADLTGIWKCL